MINRYILNSPKIVEPIVVEYTNGCLSAVIMPVKYPLKLEQYDYLIAMLPYYEKVIESSGSVGKLSATKEVGANIKLAMFCTHYMKAHEGIKYTATKQDGSKIRPFKITEELLEHYFNSSNFLFQNKHSIANLTKYYNELVIDFNEKDKSKHPDFYSAEYVKKIPQSEWPSYWKHLTAIGLAPQKDRTGATLDWIKKELLTKV